MTPQDHFSNRENHQESHKQLFVNLKVYAYCLLLSILFLVISSKTSPLCPFDDWVDTHISFTMGKGMINGKVLYKDLFDHRGPLFYFIYGLGYLISERSFLGLFIIEIISLSVFLFYSYQSIALFLSKNYSLIAIPFISFIVINMEYFSNGGSPEEFCLPLLSISLYHLLRYFSSSLSRSMSRKLFFMNGVIAGSVLWIKYSLLGFWLGWTISIIVDEILRKKGNDSIKNIGYLIFGITVSSVPWVIYFCVNNAITQWLNSYFVINLTAYAVKMTPLGRIGFILRSLSIYWEQNPAIFTFLFLGFLGFISYGKNGLAPNGIVGLFLCFFMLVVTVLGFGQARLYYFLIFAPFIIFGLIMIMKLLFIIFGPLKSEKILSLIIIMVIIPTLLYTILVNDPVGSMNMDRMDYVQYAYAKIINRKQDATLLNYGWLDIGLYTTTGIVPNVRFFHKQNFDYDAFPLIMDEQNRYVRESIPDFIVCPVPANQYDGKVDVAYLYENYQLIRDDVQQLGGDDFYYLLFKRR